MFKIDADLSLMESNVARVRAGGVLGLRVSGEHYLWLVERAFAQAEMICGACGEPWADGKSCGQKDNGHPFPTCYPLAANHWTPLPAPAARPVQGDGWRLVPQTMTDEMVDAALRATAVHLDIQGSQLTVNREKMRRRWQAALAAAPDGRLQTRPVAWRLKDFADGWIIFQDEGEAVAEAEQMGGLGIMQGLYVRDGSPVPDGRGEEAAPHLLTELRQQERDYPSLIHAPLCGRAADEIERLQGEVDRLIRYGVDVARVFAAENVALQTEVASKSEQIGKLYLVCNEKAALRTAIGHAIEALEKNSTSAPVVECLKAALEHPAVQQTWEPSDVKMADYWAETIGGSYMPIKLGKHEAGHPTTVKRILEATKGTETSDVIVGLIFWTSTVLNREQFAWDRVAELEKNESERLELRAALKPFAAWIAKVDLAFPDLAFPGGPHTEDNRTLLINGGAVVTYGDMRRAAALSDPVGKG